MGGIKKADRPGSSIKVKEIAFPSPTDFNKLRRTASTIQPKTLSNAKRFVDIRSRVKKAGGYAMGGQASESVARSKILDEMKKRRRKKLTDMLDRVYKPKGSGKPKIVPKKKPKRDKTKIGDTIKPKLGLPPKRNK
jgi:hypothetical protein